MPQKRVRFPTATLESQQPAMSLNVALRRATNDYERDPETEADDPYRPFDIATCAIQLMFPGTEEDDIELPAFEYPHVPSARSIAREHIEGLAGRQAARRPRERTTRGAHEKRAGARHQPL